MVYLSNPVCRVAVTAHIAFLLILGAVTIGCSGATDPISAPSARLELAASPDPSGCGRMLCGYYRIHLNADHSAMELEPVRVVAQHLNALTLIEVFDPTAIQLGNMFVHEDKTVTVEVSLTHPFSEYPEYTAFDIRGIAMLPHVFSFPELKVTTPGFFPGQAAMLNPDGYTRWWNPTEFSKAKSPFKYIDGSLIPPGLGAKADALVNPYKCFVSMAKRRTFEAGETVTMHYHMSFPPGPQIFGYAVDANWAEPLNPDPYIPDGFPLTANSWEPYSIQLSDYQGELKCSIGLWAGGSANMIVVARDWQGGGCVFDEEYGFDKVSLEAPSLFDGVVHPWTGGGTASTYAYEIAIKNDKQKEPGFFPALLSLETLDQDANYVAGLPLTAYQVFLIEVVEIPPPFCNGMNGIHSVYSGTYQLVGAQPALHADCSFFPILTGGAGGLLFDGGIVGDTQRIQVAPIDADGGDVPATTFIQRKEPDAGNMLVAQTNEFTGHILIVNDSDPDNLLVYSSAGSLLKEYDLGPSGEGGINEPVCLVANAANGDIWFVGHRGTEGVYVERRAYATQGSEFEYIADSNATIDLAPWLGTVPRPLGIAINAHYNYLYVFHSKMFGSIEVFDISSMPPTHKDAWSVHDIFKGQTVAVTEVPGHRKVIGGDIAIDHVDGELDAQCRILVFANLEAGASKLVRLDSWCQELGSAPLGNQFSCMALNNLPEPTSRSLVLFPLIGGKVYTVFLPPPTAW